MLTVVVILYGCCLLLKDFLSDEVSGVKVWTVVAVMAVAVMSMATLRHGMRLSLVSPVMEQSIAKSEKSQADALAAFDAAKAAPKVDNSGLPRGQVLAEEHGCLACHATNERIVGPSYAEVAKKGYSPEQILALVRNPQPKNWPDIETPMPPFLDVPAADIKEIAGWINSVK